MNRAVTIAMHCVPCISCLTHPQLLYFDGNESFKDTAASHRSADGPQGDEEDLRILRILRRPTDGPGGLPNSDAAVNFFTLS